MGAGDCFDSSADGEHVTKLPCAQPHDEQIFGRIDVDEGTDAYPGLEALREPALTTCPIAASAYFTRSAPPPGLELFVHVPTRGSWIGGVRTAACTFGIQARSSPRQRTRDDRAVGHRPWTRSHAGGRTPGSQQQ